MASRVQPASVLMGTAVVPPSAPGTSAAPSRCAVLRCPPAWRFLKENGGKKLFDARLSSNNDGPGPVSPPPRVVLGQAAAAREAASEQGWEKAGGRHRPRQGLAPARRTRWRLPAPSPSSEEPSASVTVAWHWSILSLVDAVLSDA